MLKNVTLKMESGEIKMADKEFSQKSILLRCEKDIKMNNGNWNEVMKDLKHYLKICKSQEREVDVVRISILSIEFNHFSQESV